MVEMNVLLYLKVDCSEILCVGFSDETNSILLPNVSYNIWIKNYLNVNTNVEISCFNLNNLRIINIIKILAAELSSMVLKSLQTKFQLSPHTDERKHSFLVTLPGTEKQLSLVPNIFITLTATSTKH